MLNSVLFGLIIASNGVRRGGEEGNENDAGMTMNVESKKQHRGRVGDSISKKKRGEYWNKVVLIIFGTVCCCCRLLPGCRTICNLNIIAPSPASIRSRRFVMVT